MNSNREIWQHLVAVEGIDGAGTTTLTRNLSEALKKRNIHNETGCEPTDGPIGRIIRKALSGKQPVEPETLAMLFAADRREHLYSPRGIRQTLDSGKIYITDRYFFSSLAYQSLDGMKLKSSTVRIFSTESRIPIRNPLMLSGTQE